MAVIQSKPRCPKCKDRGLIYANSKRIGRHVAEICDCKAGDEVMLHNPFKPLQLSRLIIKVGNRSFRIRLEPI